MDLSKQVNSLPPSIGTTQLNSLPAQQDKKNSSIGSQKESLKYENDQLIFSSEISLAESIIVPTLDFLSNSFHLPSTLNELHDKVIKSAFSTEQFRLISSKESTSEAEIRSEQEIASWLNSTGTRLVKVIKVIEKEPTYLNVPILRVVESYSGRSSDLVDSLRVVSFKRFTVKGSDQQPQKQSSIQQKQQLISLFLVEIDLSMANLRSFLDQTTPGRIASSNDGSFVKALSRCILSMVLQVHSRGESVRNACALECIILLKETVIIVDYDCHCSSGFERIVTFADQKSDLLLLAKSLVSIECVLNAGISLSEVEAGIKDVSSWIELAELHDCNKNLLEVSEFIEIDATGVHVYAVKNIVREMLDVKSSILSVSIAMMCSFNGLIFKDLICTGLIRGNAHISGNNSDEDYQRSMMLFKGISVEKVKNASSAAGSYLFSEQSQEEITQTQVIVKKRGEIVLEGFELNGRLSGKCRLKNVFHEYELVAEFVDGEMYGVAQLIRGNVVIDEGVVSQCVFKHWLSAPRIIDQVKIQNFLQVCRASERLSRKSKSDLILRGERSQVILLESKDSVRFDEETLKGLVGLVGNVEMINCVLWSESVLKSVFSGSLSQLLSGLKELRIQIDSEQQAELMIAFLGSEKCSMLEVLDVSASTYLDYGGYRISETIARSTYLLNSLKCLRVSDVVSSACNRFVEIVLASPLFRRIEELVLDNSKVESTLFNRMHESRNPEGLRVLSLQDVSSINEDSILFFADRIQAFRNIRELNLKGILKKSQSKSLFSDPNISAMKKLMGQLHFMQQLVVLKLDDCYFNDAVVEVLAKTLVPSLSKISLKNQQKVSVKGLTYLLQSTTLPRLETINCNDCSGLTLPKTAFPSSTFIQLSLFNCNSILPSSISDFIRGNTRLRGIRMNARLISMDVRDAILSSRSLVSLEVYCVDLADVSKVRELLLETVKKLRVNSSSSQLVSGGLEQIRICVSASRSLRVTSMQSLQDGSEMRYSRSNSNVASMNFLGSSESPIKKIAGEQELGSELLIQSIKDSIQSIKEEISLIMERIYIHRDRYVDFFKKYESVYSRKNMLTQTDNQQSQSKDQQQYEYKITSDLFSEQLLRFVNSSSNNSQKQSIDQNQRSQEQIMNGESEGVVENQRKNRMQFIEDLRDFFRNASTRQILEMKEQKLNLSRYYLSSDELSIIAASSEVGNLREFIVRQSVLSSRDLSMFARAARCFSCLEIIDLTNACLPIFPGFMDLLHVKQLPKLETVRLSQNKLKGFIRNVSQRYALVSVTSPFHHGMQQSDLDQMRMKQRKSKNSLGDQPIVVQIECKGITSDNTESKRSLHFKLKKRNQISEASKIGLDYLVEGELKVQLSQFMRVYLKNQKQHRGNQVQNLLRLLKFKESQERKQFEESKAKDENESESVGFSATKNVIRICVIGHQFAGKKSVVEAYLLDNFKSSPASERVLQDNNADCDESTIICTDLCNNNNNNDNGVKIYFTEVSENNSGSGSSGSAGNRVKDTTRNVSQQHVEIQVLNCHEYFHLLRLCAMRDSDGIIIMYDSSRDDYEMTFETASAFVDAQLFSSYKPVFVAVNRVSDHGSLKIRRKNVRVEAPLEFTEKNISIDDQSSIQSLFGDVIHSVVMDKKRKQELDSIWADELKEGVSQCELKDSEFVLDMKRVKNEIGLVEMKDFCSSVSEIDSLLQCTLSIKNWSEESDSKKVELTLNEAISNNKHKLKVRAIDSEESTQSISSSTPASKVQQNNNNNNI